MNYSVIGSGHQIVVEPPLQGEDFVGTHQRLGTRFPEQLSRLGRRVIELKPVHDQTERRELLDAVGKTVTHVLIGNGHAVRYELVPAPATA